MVQLGYRAEVPRQSHHSTPQQPFCLAIGIEKFGASRKIGELSRLCPVVRNARVIE